MSQAIGEAETTDRVTPLVPAFSKKLGGGLSPAEGTLSSYLSENILACALVASVGANEFAHVRGRC